MNPTDSMPDDSYWSSLAEELDVKPTPTPLESLIKCTEDLPDAQDHEEDTVIVSSLQDSVVDSEESSDEEDPGLEEVEGPGAGGPPGEGEPERKRRRRRRKRKKGSSSGEPESERENVSVATASADDDLESDDADELLGEQGGELIPAAAEEPPAELAQEVIANWDVPSWDEIIRGLYRPGR